MAPLGEEEKWVQGNQIPLGEAQAAQNPLSLPTLGTWGGCGQVKGKKQGMIDKANEQAKGTGGLYPGPVEGGRGPGLRVKPGAPWHPGLAASPFPSLSWLQNMKERPH